MVRNRLSTLQLSTVAFPELLHLMAALDGGLRGGDVRANTVDIIGDILPVSGTEVAAAEGVPLVAVGVDEGGGFVGGPARRRKAAGGRRSCLWWWCR